MTQPGSTAIRIKWGNLRQLRPNLARIRDRLTDVEAALNADAVGRARGEIHEQPL
jgi:hypothetical protein